MRDGQAAISGVALTEPIVIEPCKQIFEKRVEYLPVLDVLRGFAALWVCLFHFTRDGRTVAEDSIIARVCSPGWLGVQMFFVISGFVIPFSMEKRSYKLVNFSEFMVRRLKRLEPPYVVSIFVVLILPFVASFVPGFMGKQPEISTVQLLAHAAYLNAFLKYQWINPVYWTLAIEFQYYILIGLFFPCLSSRHWYVAGGSVLALGATGMWTGSSGELIFHWLPVFGFGILVWQIRMNLVGPVHAVVIGLLLVGLCLAGVGVVETLAGIIAAVLVLAFGDRQLPKLVRPIALLGTISYSFYLLHEPVWNRLFNLVARLPRQFGGPEARLAVGVVGSVVLSALFWRLVEVPSQKWSRRSGVQRM